MIPQKEISRLIEAFLNNELEPEDKSILIHLVNESSFIKDEFELRRKINQAIQNKEVMELREQLEGLLNNEETRDRLSEPFFPYQTFWFKFAASMLLVMGLTFVLYNQIAIKQKNENNTVATAIPPGTDKPNNKVIEQSNAQESEEEVTPNIEFPRDEGSQKNPDRNSDNVLSANSGPFKESEYFESFIDNFRSPEIRIIQPVASAKYGFGSDIMFVWHYHPKDDSLLLSIFSNQEERLVYRKIANEYILKQNFGPGTYYWKLESEEDLIFMNKFEIK